MTTGWVRGAASAGVALVMLAAGASSAPAQGEAESLSASFRKAARAVLPAVVTVRGAGRLGPDEAASAVPPFNVPRPEVPGGRMPASGGSGVVIDAAKGYVLTNDHVIQDGMRMVVTLQDGRERTARQVRRDPRSDLALLTIDPEGLRQAEWGDSEALDTGDWVLAVGQPFGLSGTVTAGIVSGKGRGLGLSWYEDLIQTDAAINPGNSGGPLVNLRGQVVGINTAIRSINGGFEGVGFAVPAARARRVAADLAEIGHVRRAQIGVRIGRPNPEATEAAGGPGAVPILSVAAGGPAAEAGLRAGDVIVKVGGKPMAGPATLQAVVEWALVGEPLEVTILRDGQTRDVRVRPSAQQPEPAGVLPGIPSRPRPPAPPMPDGPGR
jgi:S1-C subfamily serine protease